MKNSIEEESTFFVTIEKNNIRSQIHNFKNMKSKYFCRPIKVFRKNPNKNNNNSLSFLNKDITNSQQTNTPPPSNQSQLKKINNISKINIMQNYTKKEKGSNSFLLENENKNKKENKNLDDDTEENIDIEDDIDEFCDERCNININKPKLPFFNKNYYNNNSSLSISRNILNNYLNKTSNSNSKINKMKDYHNKCRFYKNKSCFFINNSLLKLKVNQNIMIANSKIDMLKNLIKRRNLQILSLQLFFEKNNVQHKIRKNFKNCEKKEDEQNKEIFNLRLKKERCEDKYINKKIHENEIKQEILKFSDKKLEIIEKIIDIKMQIFNNNHNKNIFNSNLHNIDESTIINDSNIFEYEYNVMETKENIKNNGESALKSNIIIKEKNGEEINKINHNEINCIKNKNATNYFLPRFLIETKAHHYKNKLHNRHNLNINSKFNIFINCNNGK